MAEKPLYFFEPGKNLFLVAVLLKGTELLLLTRIRFGKLRKVLLSFFADVIHEVFFFFFLARSVLPLK